MDDTAQKQKLANNNAQPQIPVQSQPPVTPVGSTNKEIGVAPVVDFVRPSEPEPIRDREVVEAGVQKIEQEIKVEEEHERMGIRVEPAPIITESTRIDVQSLMTPDEIKADLKKGPGIFNLSGHYLGIYFVNSRDFLAKLLDKILRKPSSQPA
jgi:hypothetical protein